MSGSSSCGGFVLGLQLLLLLIEQPLGQRHIAALVVARIEEVMINIDVEYAIDGGQRNVLNVRHLALHEHLERDLDELARVHLEFLALHAVEAVQCGGVVELRRVI